MVKRLAIR